MTGGAPYTPSYSFRDIIGHSSSDKWGWSGSQMTSASRFALQGSGGINRWGANTCISTQIQAGDNPLGGTNTERNEVLQMFGTGNIDEPVSSIPQYYAFSTYIPSGWVDPVGTGQWFIIVQAHGDDTNTGHSAQANIQFLLASNSVGASPAHYTLRTVGGPITGSGTVDADKDVITDIGAHVYDTWVDWVLAITWGSGIENVGHITVYKRVQGTDNALQQIVDKDAYTAYSVNGATQLKRYWKRGIYRNGDGAQGTVTIYVSPFTRASTMAAACMGSFGQYP